MISNLKSLYAALSAFAPGTKIIGMRASGHSYRGFYENFAFMPSDEEVSVEDLMHYIRSEVYTKTFCGWKGGTFEYNDYSCFHIAPVGTCYTTHEDGDRLAGFIPLAPGLFRAVTIDQVLFLES